MRNIIKEWYEGHITITVRGKRFERFLNMAVREGIQIWNIHRLGTGLSRCDIMIRDYFRLRPFLRETGCRTHVEQREGLPFWLIRMRKRSGFALGAFLFLFGLYMLSSFVWNVEVQGTHHIAPYKVIEAAEKIGIKAGAWKVKLKEQQILKQELLSRLPEASWVGIRIQGTKAIIEVVEKEEPVPYPALGPRNLVAKKRAVVQKIVAESGKGMVKVHQFVDKGQVLISGLIGNETNQKLVPAKGKVEGEVWYVSNVSVPLAQTQFHLTGQQKQDHFFLAGNYAIRIWPYRDEPFAREEASEERHQLGYGDFSLPIGWKTVTKREMEIKTKNLSIDEAVELGKKFARQDILKKAAKDATIKDEKVLHVKAENGKVYLSIHYAVIEDISMEQPLVSAPPAPSPEGSVPNP